MESVQLLVPQSPLSEVTLLNRDFGGADHSNRFPAVKRGGVEGAEG